MPEDNLEFNFDKEKQFSEWFTEVVKQAELADQRYEVKGLIIHRPNATFTENKMRRMLEDALEKRGHKPCFFPAIIPESYFAKEAEHVEGFAPGVFWITKGGTDPEFPERLALRPTSETAMYTAYADWIRSYQDLPLKIYQSCQVWRYETKHTRPFIRDREFYWLEAHDVFATREEAEAQVLQDMETTEEVVHDGCGLPFFFFKRPEWDKFAGGVYSFACDAIMPDGKVLQLPSTHYYGENFAKVFNIKFVDKDEKEKYAHQTTYGPAYSRIYAALIAMHGDSKGLVLPYDLAATQVVIIPVIFKGKEKIVVDHCHKLLKSLQAKGIRAEFDNSNKTPGYKYNYWELRGAAIRVEVGPREVENKELTIVRRDLGKKEKIKEAGFDEYLSTIGSKMLKDMKKRADEWFQDRVTSAKTMDELGKQLAKGGFVRVNFCSRDMDAVPCADEIGEKLQAEVRGTLHGKAEKPAGNCIVCGKKAKEVVYVARAY